MKGGDSPKLGSASRRGIARIVSLAMLLAALAYRANFDGLYIGVGGIARPCRIAPAICATNCFACS